VRLTYFDLGTPMPDFARTIDQLIPTFSINDTTSIYYSHRTQYLYAAGYRQAPCRIRTTVPWAGFPIYLGRPHQASPTIISDNVEATLGVVGPAALGEQIQKFVHKNISDSPTAAKAGTIS
jgi:lipid A 3-O-deacylase